jgi:GNAT superfamily N-acetyltransferase
VSGEVTIRPARSSDAASLTDAWIEFGRYYAALEPALYRVPEEVGEWVESDLRAERGDDEVWLVAERDGRFVGCVRAKIKRPAEDAGKQLVRDAGESVLNVHALLVVEDERRIGVGTALMRAAEDWARGKGATRSFLNTFADSPSAVPFYEEGMGYQPKILGFWKQL